MKKPIKPKKPHKNDKKPSKDLEVEKWICVDDGDNLFLRPVEYDEYGYIKSYRRSDLYAEPKIDFYDLQRINDLLEHGYDLTSITDQGYFEGWLVSWIEENKNYQNELEEYNNRFELYENKLRKYEEDVLRYNIHMKEMEIEKLKKKMEEKLKDLVL